MEVFINMSKKIQQPYDKLHKTFTRAFGNETLKFLKIDSEVKEFLSTEIISIENRSKFVDMLIQTVDDLLIHIEFHSGDIKKSTLYRNNAYSADLANITKKDVRSFIISLGEKDKSVLELKMENIHYTPDCEFLREYNGDEILNTLKDKMYNEKDITGEDLFFLVFLPFTSHKRSDEEMAEEMFELTNIVPLTEEQKIEIKQCQKIILEIYFGEDDEKMHELEGLINMECTYFQRYEEKIVTEALEKGYIKIAKELKKDNRYTKEEIAEITKLDPKTVEQL